MRQRTADIARLRLGIGKPSPHWIDRLVDESRAIGFQQSRNQARRAEFYARWFRQKPPLIQIERL